MSYSGSDSVLIDKISKISDIGFRMWSMWWGEKKKGCSDNALFLAAVEKLNRPELEGELQYNFY